MSFVNDSGLSYFYSKLKEKFIRSINSMTPDTNGNVAITNVATADNLTSPDAQASYDTFIYRTSGGSASLESGEAQLVYIDGNINISGRIIEDFDIITTNDILITYSASIWRNQISSSGQYIFSYTKPTSSTATSSWNPLVGNWSYDSSTVSLASYGLYESNVTAPSIATSITGSNISALQVVPNSWMGQFSSTGNYIFVYDDNENSWMYNNQPISLTTYGITVSGSPTDGDQIIITYTAGTPDSTITINYTAPDQGTITVAQPITFSATGFNQFDNSSMYIQNATINNNVITSNSGTYLCYCHAKGGVTNGYVAYSSGGHIRDIGWCENLPDIGEYVVTTGQSVSSTLASIPFDDDGYVVVVVTSMNDLCIHPKWSGSADTEYEAYVAPSVINLPTTDVENTTIPIGDYGMPAVGSVADRLNLDAGTYIQKVGRLSNTVSNMNYVTSLDVDYDYDDNYIYYVLPSPVTYTVDIDPIYTVNDFGTEEFTGTSVALHAQMLYGQNLRDKLRTDVLTISSQELSDTQKLQVYNNLGLAAIHVSGTISAFPYTITDSRITANHRVVNAIFGAPANVTTDVTWTTSAGSCVFSGTLSSGTTTTIDFELLPTIS